MTELKFEVAALDFVGRNAAFFHKQYAAFL